VKHLVRFINESSEYEKDCEAIRKYCKDNIDDFDARYGCALTIIGRERCSLEHADYELSDEIYNCMRDWCDDNNKDINDFYLDDIF